MDCGFYFHSVEPANLCYKRTHRDPRSPTECCCILHREHGLDYQKVLSDAGTRLPFPEWGSGNPSHHSTLHSTGRDSDKAETMRPQDFRTKHFYFPQKRAAEQPFPLASELRNSGL